MSRDGMPRAYLRIDPNIDQTMPDLDAFIRLLCSAQRQPERGRFKDRVLLNRAIGTHKATRAIARGDVVILPDGRLYVDGWDEWQEGDLTVGDRMRRMRAKRASQQRHSTVTTPSPNTPVVTTDALDTQASDDRRIPPNPPPSGGHGLRANGTAPRQRAKAIDEARKAEEQRRHEALSELRMRYYRGEITEAEHAHLMAELVPQ